MGPTPASSLPQKLFATVLLALLQAYSGFFCLQERETEGGSVAVVPPIAPVCAAKTRGCDNCGELYVPNECSETMLEIKILGVVWEVQIPGLRGEEADWGRCGRGVFTDLPTAVSQGNHASEPPTYDDPLLFSSTPTTTAPVDHLKPLGTQALLSHRPQASCLLFGCHFIPASRSWVILVGAGYKIHSYCLIDQGTMMKH